MTAKSPLISSLQILLLIAASFMSSLGAAQNADQAYRTPPLDIADIVDARPTPTVSVDPTKGWMLILGRPGLPSITELSQPELRIASVRQQPDGIHLQTARGIVDPHQKFLSLHQGVKAAIIQHPRMNEHILIHIVGCDKAVSAKVIKELHNGTHLAILGLARSWRCRRERPFNRQ